jgi:hypothetical protein
LSIDENTIGMLSAVLSVVDYLEGMIKVMMDMYQEN